MDYIWGAAEELFFETRLASSVERAVAMFQDTLAPRESAKVAARKVCRPASWVSL